MNRYILIPSIILGVISIVIYIFRCHKIKRPIDNKIAVMSILNGSGIIGGVFLVGAVLLGKLKDNIDGNEIFIAIGGVAVLIYSGQELYRSIIVSTKSKGIEAETDTDVKVIAE